MEEITDTSLVCVEPQTLELSSDLSKEVRERVADVTRFAFEDISHNLHFARRRGKAPANRNLHWFLADYEITAPRKGQVPEQSTRILENRKATFSNWAPIIGRLLWFPDRRALPATGTWPTLITNQSNMNRSLLQEGEIIATWEL